MGRSFTKRVLLFLFAIFLLFLSGCQNAQFERIRYHSGKEIGTEMKAPLSSVESIVTYQTNMEQFRFVVGWESNKEILISESNGEQDVIFSYNIENGERKDRFFSDHPIISAKISPSKKYLLIHTSPLLYEASIRIYRLDTDELVLEKTFESSEIDYEWNRDWEDKILIVTFYADWTFQPYILHIDEERIETVELPHPFVYWFGDHSWILLNWNYDIPSMTAPLVVYKKGSTETAFPEKEFYYLDRLGDSYVAIGVSEKDEKEAEFIFFDKKMQPFFSFYAPHLSTFSGWQIPYYNYIEETKEFIMIEPIAYGEADIYKGGFQLVKFNLESGEKSVLLNQIENTPLNCSPDGKFCLTGHLFEKMIALKSGDMMEFIQF
ncbi:hypothetical protein [Fervidibacillus halotolerans]|uniref:YqgU-like 6-bladed beta-propeller domain-containing protein n=1 Tax=Fervidibacillus halotolerans TaxID=2980027 RepID=A0A9E8LXG0_9BACI|nr:hypothetical protein [Fervidibacillus halotolerans]WAA11455.1 hypothetical protein OE105_07360 [Fervidibacillus halotolerans]